MRPLNEEIKLVKVSDVTSAGTSTISATGVDLSADGGWDGVLLFASFGTAAADNLLHAEQSPDDGTEAYADLADSQVSAGGNSNEEQWVDIFRPQEKWVRVVADRGTSTTIENMWAILYRGRSKPYSNITAGTINGIALVSPAEGTK